MELAKEKNNDLAFDTELLRTAATKYTEAAEKLSSNCKKLDALVLNLKISGWTTEAGEAFYDLMKTNWAENIKKYVDLLNTLSSVLNQAATDYDTLLTDYVYETKIDIEQP